MGKNQSASNLTNIIQVSSTGNVLFVSGSTTLMSISSSGAITTTGVISGSNALSASYAANADTLDGLDSTVFTLTSSFNAFSSSILTYTGSANSRLGSIETVTGSNITRLSSIETVTGSNITRLNSIEVITGSNITRLNSIETVTGSNITRLGALETATGSLYSYTSSLNLKTASFATTGSNTFIGTQTISGSVLQSGSFTTTGTIIAQTINVQTVTSSIVYSSGSNIFGNLLGDSQRFTGSVLITGSLTIAGGSSATSYSGTTIYGSTVVCSAVGLFSGCVGIGTVSPGARLEVVATGENVLKLKNSGGQPSLVRFNDTSTTLDPYIGSYGNDLAFGTYGGGEKMRITSTGVACFLSTVCSPAFVGGTITGTTIYGSTAICSPVGKFTSCIDITSVATTGTALRINADNLTTGTALSIVSNDGSASHTGNLVEICNAFNAGAAAKLMCLYQGDDGDGIYINMARGGTGLTVDGAGTGYSAIFNNGNMGIGTSAPLSLLHIASADTDQGIRLTRANGTYGVRITRTGQIQGKLVDDVTFQTAISLSEGNASGSQHLILQPTAGKVGIGCLDSPTYHLEVRCAASVSSCYLVAMFARSTGANDGIGDIIAFGANGVSSIAGMYRSGGGSWGLELQTANQNTRMRIDNSGISCFACQLCAPVGIFSGCVSIGSTSPNYANLVICNAAVNSGNNSALTIGRATSLPSSAADYGNIFLFSTDAYAADKGGTISFGSQYGSSGGETRMSGIFGGKENATNGDYSGYLSFYTRLSGNQPAERMRITSNGSVGIGITSTGTNVKMKIKSATEGSGISLSSATLVIARCATDTQLGFGYYTTPDAWVISSTYGSDGAYKPLVLATSDVERFRICSNGNATFACSVNFNGNGSVTSKVGGVYNGTTTITIGPSSWNGVMQIMVGVYGNGSGNTGRAMWIGGGYIGGGMPFTEVTRYCAGAVTISTLNANANCYTFTVGYSFPNSADISVTVIGTNANTVPATIEFG